MPTSRFRSVPHPQHVLAWAIHASTDTFNSMLQSRYCEPGWREDFVRILVPDEPFPAFPSGVQYQGTSQAAVRPWRHYPASCEVYLPRPGSERTRHMICWHGVIDDYSHGYTLIQTSTDYSLSADGKMWVAMPIDYVTPYDFPRGTFGGSLFPEITPAMTIPGFPISPFTQSYLCFPMYLSRPGNSFFAGHGPDFFAFAKCTAGFTAHFVNGDLGAWQSGHAYQIDDVTAFGYSDAVAIESATGVLGFETPWEF